LSRPVWGASWVTACHQLTDFFAMEDVAAAVVDL